MSVETVEGSTVTIRFDGSRCIHSRNCVLGLPTVFVPNVEGAWIHPDGAPADEVLHVARSCPSGAIRAWMNDGSATSDSVPEVNTVRTRENGPLAFEAPMLIRGEREPTVRAVLCRCGASASKPWCDGSHARIGFTATGEPPTGEFTDLAARDGDLSIQPLRNGPLEVTGNLEVVSGTGRTINKVTSTHLCRCGHSGHKPYCDGSHKRVGFQAD